jgi:hypothetical protein
MNGLRGLVTAGAASDGRLAVMLEGAAKPKAIKEVNLKKVEV